MNQERNALGFLLQRKVELTVDDDLVDNIIKSICEGGYNGGGCDESCHAN